jgi:hypothetical protein
MTTNQTQVITTTESFSVGGAPLAITNQINAFVESGIASGYINFQIMPVVISAQPIATMPHITYGFMCQINYYDPSIM